MDAQLNLQELRGEIDQIDNQILDLIGKRLKKIFQVAEYKKEHAVPIFAPERESEIFQKVEDRFGSENSSGFKLLYGFLMDLNKYMEYRRVVSTVNIPTKMDGASIRATINDTPFSLCRYLCPLAAAEVSILSIHSESIPGGRLLVDLELAGDTGDPAFSAVLSVLADASEKFTIL